MRRLNIDGDGQGDLAGHGGEHRAVFVYQIESYRYWQEQLGRDDFEYGQFGENFTVSGLADDQVCIGDRYQVGEALFEVTQPRVTCYRVGIGAFCASGDPGGIALPPPGPGQFLTLRLDAAPGARPLLRSYSLSGAPDAGSYRVSVKREEHGAGS